MSRMGAYARQYSAHVLAAVPESGREHETRGAASPWGSTPGGGTPPSFCLLRLAVRPLGTCPPSRRRHSHVPGMSVSRRLSRSLPLVFQSALGHCARPVSPTLQSLATSENNGVHSAEEECEMMRQAPDSMNERDDRALRASPEPGPIYSRARLSCGPFHFRLGRSPGFWPRLAHVRTPRVGCLSKELSARFRRTGQGRGGCVTAEAGLLCWAGKPNARSSSLVRAARWGGGAVFARKAKPVWALGPQAVWLPLPATGTAVAAL